MKLNLSPQDQKLANYLAGFPLIHSVPIYFGNPTVPGSKISNGTGTLLKRGKRLFVATNHHVLKKCRMRQKSEDGIVLQVGGFGLKSFEDRVRFDDEVVDVAVLEFSDRQCDEFQMSGNVLTKFYEVGDLDPLQLQKGKVVAFGGYPGTFRVQVATNEVNFYTFSSGASVVEEITDKTIVVNIDHRESKITSLSAHAPPEELGGMSGGPVFLISSKNGIMTFRFAGIISECSQSFQVMLAKPVSLFSDAFE